MLRKILIYGTIAGILVGAMMSATTVGLGRHLPSPWGMVVGYLTMLIALSAVFVAIKRHRDIDLGGVIGFWPAFGLGVGISVVAGILYVLAWEATMAATQMDFAGDYARMLIEEEKAKGVSGDALAAFTAEMERFKSEYARPAFRLPMTFVEIFPVGVLVSLVSAGLLRNPRVLPLRRSGRGSAAPSGV